MTVYTQACEDLCTIRDFLRFAVSLCHQHEISCGHGYVEPWDEAVAILLHALHLPQDVDPRILDARLTLPEKQAFCRLLARRVDEKVPTAYLIGEAWFAGALFTVNESVLVPRSPIAELIEAQFSPWIEAENLHSVLDLCTGSGCIAIATALHCPETEVSAVDICAQALSVAKQNVARHDVSDRVQLIESDCWASVPKQQFDVIVSNPPYVAPDEYASLPQEYTHEPRIGLEAQDEGLVIVEEILAKAPDYLSDHGILIVEVGNAQHELIQRYPRMPFCWLEFARGGTGIFLLTKQQLEAYHAGQ